MLKALRQKIQRAEEQVIFMYNSLDYNHAAFIDLAKRHIRSSCLQALDTAAAQPAAVHLLFSARQHV